MAKNSKKSKVLKTNGSAPALTPNEAQGGGRPPVSETAATAKALRTKSGRKHPGASTSKAAPGKKAKKTVSREKFAAADVSISDDDIRLRAYLISEWRMQNGVAGDSTLDWLEARRQLQEETR